MDGYVFVVCGIVLALIGGLFWWKQEPKKQLLNFNIVFSIFLILTGGIGILYGLERYIHDFGKSGLASNSKTVRLWEWLFIIGLIYIGTVSYTIAAYYHLKLKNWSFILAFAIALPLILIEYQFSLRGNFAAKNVLNLNAVQITLITMVFYFINAWLLNFVLLKQPMIWWRESLAFLCVIAAFVLSTRSHI